MRLDRAEDKEFDSRQLQQNSDFNDDSLLIDSLGDNVYGDPAERSSPSKQHQVNDRLK